MSHTNVDDNVRAIEIGIDAEEEELGAVGGRYITWKRAAVYIYETAGGGLVVGFSAPPPWRRFDPDIERAKARRTAFLQLLRFKYPAPRSA